MESKEAKLIKTENRMVISRDWEEGDMERYCSKSINFQL